MTSHHVTQERSKNLYVFRSMNESDFHLVFVLTKYAFIFVFGNQAWTSAMVISSKFQVNGYEAWQNSSFYMFLFAFLAMAVHKTQ